MTSPGRILHVFPYDPRHLGQSFERWAESQLERWPLAAILSSRLASRSSAHVIGPRRRRLRAPPLEVVEHFALTSGPRYRDWGDDWSLGFGKTLAGLGPDDVCVIHLNDYVAARLAQRSAARSRVVIVFHGRGVGPFDDHLLTAERLVVLRADAAHELVEGGARPEQVVVHPPSIDRSRFFTDPSQEEPGDSRLGFIGRLERSKGVLEVPPLLARLAAEGVAARAELAGPFNHEQRSELERIAVQEGTQDRVDVLGELQGAALAQRMRRWRLLLLPSYSEGSPLVALEARACGLPVAAVAGVLPAELERRPGVFTAPRELYPELVLGLLRQGHPPPPADWVRDHAAAAAEWDALLESLPPRARTVRPAVSRLRRARRFRPPRLLARAVLRRRG